MPRVPSTKLKNRSKCSARLGLRSQEKARSVNSTELASRSTLNATSTSGGGVAARGARTLKGRRAAGGAGDAEIFEEFAHGRLVVIEGIENVFLHRREIQLETRLGHQARAHRTQLSAV